MTMIGLGNLMEVIWPVIGRTVGGDDVATRVIGVTADEADIPRKEAFFGFEVILNENLEALRRNRPDVILFAPPPTVAPGLIESVLRPYYDECRADGLSLPDLYAFPPLPLGSTYLDALGEDVLVANIIPNNVTSIAGRPVVDEGMYVCTFAKPWPDKHLARLQQLFEGQGAFVRLEPDQLIPMLGGACAVSCLWKVVPALADILADTTDPVGHNEIAEYLRGQIRQLSGFSPAVSTPVRADLHPPHAALLAMLARSWYDGVDAYFGDTTLEPDAARTILERVLDQTLHTIQAEPREVLDGHAVGAATKGGVLERAIRSAREDLMPLIEAGVTDTPTGEWAASLASQVRATAHAVREHGTTLAG